MHQTNDRAARLTTLLQQIVARRPLRHGVMSVERGDGSFRWSGAAGEADDAGRPMDPETPFFIASIDKLLNATIALALAERGALDLEAPITRFLPAEVTTRLHVWKGEDVTPRVTVRHLLGHTSGLAEWLEDRRRGGTSLADRVIEGGDRALDLREIAALVRELTPRFPPQDLFAPRRRARYSDTNYLLLGFVIETVTGRPLPDVQEDVLYRPLGMHHTWCAGLSTPLEPAPPAAVLSAGGRTIEIPLLMRSFKGIYSTTADLIAFLRGLMTDRLLRPATRERMMAERVRFGLPTDAAALRAPGWPIEYGLGIKRFQLPRIFNAFRRMPPVFGHSGSTGTWLFYCPERDLYLAGAIDEVTAGAVPYRLLPKILGLFD